MRKLSNALSGLGMAVLATPALAQDTGSESIPDEESYIEVWHKGEGIIYKPISEEAQAFNDDLRKRAIRGAKAVNQHLMNNPKQSCNAYKDLGDVPTYIIKDNKNFPAISVEEALEQPRHAAVGVPGIKGFYLVEASLEGTALKVRIEVEQQIGERIKTTTATTVDYEADGRVDGVIGSDNQIVSTDGLDLSEKANWHYQYRVAVALFGDKNFDFNFCSLISKNQEKI